MLKLIFERGQELMGKEEVRLVISGRENRACKGTEDKSKIDPLKDIAPCRHDLFPRLTDWQKVWLLAGRLSPHCAMARPFRDLTFQHLGPLLAAGESHVMGNQIYNSWPFTE